MSHDIYQILENLDAAQRSVKQMPALFKPKNISPVIDGEYGKKHPADGYLVGESQEDSPVLRSILARIANGRPELLTRHGVEAVIHAAESVAEFVGDVDEIGTSDVSGWVRQVEEYLQDWGKDNMDENMLSASTRAPAVPKAPEVYKDQVGEARNSNPANMSPQDYERYQQQQMDWEKRDFKRRELEHELAGEEEAYRREMSGTWYIRINGRLLKDRNGTPYSFRGKAAANKAAVTMMAKPFNKGKEFTLTTSATDRQQDIKESTTTEDVISTVKKKLGDYLADLSQEIKNDPDLKDKVPNEIDQIGPAVKTIRTDDGHEIKIHGNEDDGFRITIKNRPSQSTFESLDHATMAVEMYCNRRRGERPNQDYMEEA